MKAYYINLASRTDRRDAMEQQLAQLGLSAQRIEAQPFDLFSADLKARFAHASAGTRFGRNEFGNAVSHLRARERMLESGDAYGLMLEDDAVLSPSLPALLAQIETSDQPIDILRLETFGNPQQISQRPFRRLGQFGVHTIHGWAWGSAAYVLSRRAAELLTAFAGSIEGPFDRLIYRPNSLPVASLVRGQLVPALAMQQDRLPGQVWGADSDITETRTEMVQAPNVGGWSQLAQFVEHEIHIGLYSSLHRLLRFSEKRDIPFKPD